MSGTLGVIGSGMIGGAIARLAVRAGIDVVLSNSRGPDSLRGLVSDLGPRARAATPEEAASAGDWVAIAVPFSAVPHLPVEALSGSVVLDATNYYPTRDGVFAELDRGELTAAEAVQRRLRGARTVKAFSTIYFEHAVSLARPRGSVPRNAIPITGDDQAAKEVVAALVGRLGHDTVDAGPLAESWRLQGGSPAYVVPYLADPRLP